MEFDLYFKKDHLYFNINGNDWLLDTGAPTSFGKINEIVIENCYFQIPKEYAGLTADKLSVYAQHDTVGLIGTDILNQFNILLDLKRNKILFSTEEINLKGEVLTITELMGVPIVDLDIAGKNRPVFFDTGAQISYLQKDYLADYPLVGNMKDFYPGVGEFETDIHLVNLTLGPMSNQVRCGLLPELLNMTLAMAGVEGIMGNEIIKDKVIGYFPKQKQIVFDI